MSCVDMRIIDFNYVFQPNVGLSASSVDSNFPISNLRHPFRSKVVRTTGTFRITTSNNKIDFRRVSLGPQLTATLTVGTYTPTTLATHIKAQLDAAGTPDVFTVTYSTLTGRWTIASSGSYLDLLWASGTNTANSVAASLGFDASVDHTGAVTYTGASIAIHTSEWIDIDLYTQEPIDAFAMIFDPVLAVKFTEGAVLRLQGSATQNFDVTTPVDVTLAIDNDSEVVTHYFATAVAHRYWRLTAVDPKNPSLHLEFPKLVLGKSLAVTKLPQTGFKIGIEDPSLRSRTIFGHEFMDVLPLRKGLGFSLIHVPDSEAEELWRSYSRTGIGMPILLVIDSQEVLFDKDRFTLYGRYQPKLEGGHIARDLFGFDIVVEEAF